MTRAEIDAAIRELRELANEIHAGGDDDYWLGQPMGHHLIAIIAAYKAARQVAIQRGPYADEIANTVQTDRAIAKAIVTQATESEGGK